MSLAFYTEPGVFTSPGHHAALLEPLPADPAELAAVGHGLIIHEHWAPAYGRTVTDEERATVHLRRVSQQLEQVLAVDGSPLSTARPIERRIVGNCRHFTVLLVTILRAKGIPARARCGFGAYFTRGFNEDHWVCEYWNSDGWRLLDGQIDQFQRDRLPIDFDLTDVPRDEFLVAGEAWRRFRSGAAAPGTFGLSGLVEGGDWWIAGNLMRDLAALRNVEVLPWDVWGAMPAPEGGIPEDLAELFDRLAALTADPDGSFDELETLYADPRLTVPATVYNVLRDRHEEL